MASRGIEVRKGDLSDSVSLEKAFAGADRVLIISTDTAPGSGTRLKQHEGAVAAQQRPPALRASLYTSMPKPEVSVISFAFEHLGSEKAVKESGLPYTIFRNGWYQENLFMSLPQALKTRAVVHLGRRRPRRLCGARDDFAAAIAGGLASDDADNRIYTLTGTGGVFRC